MTQRAKFRWICAGLRPLALLMLWLLPLANARAENTVVVLSWDGLRHDFMDRGEFPALTRLAQHGARAERLTTVFPSDTFPSHISLATGTYPDRHGIVGNHFIDRQQGRYGMSAQTHWLEAEPLWIAAERQGVPTATYFWVGSEQDWRGQGTRYRMSPFDGGRPEQEKVDQILAWLALPADESPRLVMSYWRGADNVGHRYGPNSRRITSQLSQQDAQLDRLLQGIDTTTGWDKLTLLLVSDHGMTVAGDYLPVREALADAKVEARMVGNAVAHVFLAEPDQRSAARSAISAVHADLQVFDGDQLPAQWRLQHPQRTGDLVVVAPPPFVLSQPPGFDGFSKRVLGFFGWDFGGHGYDPQLPDMGAAFLAMGRSVPAGTRLGTVRAIDLAATVAQLLEINPPRDSEGVPIQFASE